MGTGVSVGTGVAVGATVGVSVGKGVTVGAGVHVGTGVSTGGKVGVGVGSGVAVGIGVQVGQGVTVGRGVGVGVAVAVAVAVAFDGSDLVEGLTAKLVAVRLWAAPIHTLIVTPTRSDPCTLAVSMRMVATPAVSVFALPISFPSRKAERAVTRAPARFFPDQDRTETTNHTG